MVEFEENYGLWFNGLNLEKKYVEGYVEKGYERFDVIIKGRSLIVNFLKF